jgi:hypothetical protein
MLREGLRIVRSAEGSSSCWDRGDIEQIVKKFFKLVRDPKPSAFRCESLQQELDSAAAVYTAFNRDYLSPLYVVRFGLDELTRAGLTLEDNPGTTGCRSADVRHVELVNGPEAFSQLVTITLTGWNRDERVRTIPVQELREALVRLNAEPNEPGFHGRCARLLHEQA